MHTRRLNKLVKLYQYQAKLILKNCPLHHFFLVGKFLSFLIAGVYPESYENEHSSIDAYELYNCKCNVAKSYIFSSHEIIFGFQVAINFLT